jgi:septal ring factor EnvC (AmiA/AmiB activator)
MKPRSTGQNESASELDDLNERLAQVRAASRRLAARRIATERKLEHIGRNLSDLKTRLAKTPAAKAKSKR